METSQTKKGYHLCMGDAPLVCSASGKFQIHVEMEKVLM